MRSHRLLLSAFVLLAVAASPLWAKKRKEEPGAQAAPAASSTTDSRVAGYLGDLPITLEEVDREAAPQLREVRQSEYAARRAAFERLADQKLVEKEAAARGLSVPDLLKAEVEDKVAQPTEDEIGSFYEKNKARFGGRTKEEVREQIRQSLRAQKAAGRRSEFYRELRQRAGLRFLLDPPRVQVPIPPGEPARGPENAPITLVEFADFQCPFCRRSHPTVEQLLEEYKDKVRYVFRDYPLSFHQRAFPASEAARCAGDQGKYWEYYDSLMEVSGDLSDADLKKRATDLGLDLAAFTACLESDRHEAAIRAGLEDGSAAGVSGTPSFFINGRMIVGAKPIHEFKTIIEEELARLEGAPGQGGSAQTKK